MFLASGVSFTVALMLTSQVLAASSPYSDPFDKSRLDPGQSRSEWSDNSRRSHGDVHDGSQDSRRGHRGDSRHRRRSGADLLVAPNVAFANPATRVPLPSRNAQAARVPFMPPVHFSYYCNDPPGWFPAVSACGGQWLETGTQPSP
jgi:hypothetical protein